jgi:YjjG family noncanonical pyrimidine nucleotidase
MTKYKCIFFDLDHTIWDYETNSHEALHELFHHYSLAGKGVTDFDTFFSRFRDVNAKLWELYDRGVITSDTIRRERFDQVLAYFSIHDPKFSHELSVEYLDICPKKGNLMPNALETIEYLSRKYDLTIVTNGFEEIQHVKLSSGKVNHFFHHIITSQKAGHRKPAKEIFEFALRANNVEFHETIMIGDNLITDVGGARNAGIDTVYFNPYSIAHQDDITFEIKNLAELCSFL